MIVNWIILFAMNIRIITPGEYSSRFKVYQYGLGWNVQGRAYLILGTLIGFWEQDPKALEVRIAEVAQGKSRSYSNILTCFAILENEYRETKRKYSNANNTPSIYNSSATLEPFLRLQYTIWIISYDLTHNQHNSLSSHSCHIVQFLNTSHLFVIIQNYTATIRPHSWCLPTSLHLLNTSPSTPSPTSHYNS